MPRATNHKIKQQSYAEQRCYDVKFGTNPPHIQHVIYHIMRIIDILLHLTFSLFHIHIIFSEELWTIFLRPGLCPDVRK